MLPTIDCLILPASSYSSTPRIGPLEIRQGVSVPTEVGHVITEHIVPTQPIEEQPIDRTFFGLHMKPDIALGSVVAEDTEYLLSYSYQWNQYPANAAFARYMNSLPLGEVDSDEDDDEDMPASRSIWGLASIWYGGLVVMVRRGGKLVDFTAADKVVFGLSIKRILLIRSSAEAIDDMIHFYDQGYGQTYMWKVPDATHIRLNMDCMHLILNKCDIHQLASLSTSVTPFASAINDLFQSFYDTTITQFFPDANIRRAFSYWLRQLNAIIFGAAALTVLLRLRIPIATLSIALPLGAARTMRTWLRYNGYRRVKREESGESVFGQHWTYRGGTAGDWTWIELHESQDERAITPILSQRSTASMTMLSPHYIACLYTDLTSQKETVVTTVDLPNKFTDLGFHAFFAGAFRPSQCGLACPRLIRSTADKENIDIICWSGLETVNGGAIMEKCPWFQGDCRIFDPPNPQAAALTPTPAIEAAIRPFKFCGTTSPLHLLPCGLTFRRIANGIDKGLCQRQLLSTMTSDRDTDHWMATYVDTYPRIETLANVDLNDIQRVVLDDGTAWNYCTPTGADWTFALVGAIGKASCVRSHGQLNDDEFVAFENYVYDRIVLQQPGAAFPQTRRLFDMQLANLKTLGRVASSELGYQLHDRVLFPQRGDCSFSLDMPHKFLEHHSSLHLTYSPQTLSDYNADDYAGGNLLLKQLEYYDEGGNYIEPANFYAMVTQGSICMVMARLRLIRWKRKLAAICDYCELAKEDRYSHPLPDPEVVPNSVHPFYNLYG
ncbi:hypothetical protein ONZ45_g5523 [Pleurotus djamor]|nr:hypothetical protein ONZ45_g5523 [Pleurotus djamor]